MNNMKYLQVHYEVSLTTVVLLWGRFYLLCANIHWHVSTVVYKWGHLADCKMSQFIKQQKIHFVNKRACVTNVLTEKQQMSLVACHSV